MQCVYISEASRKIYFPFVESRRRFERPPVRHVGSSPTRTRCCCRLNRSRAEGALFVRRKVRVGREFFFIPIDYLLLVGDVFRRSCSSNVNRVGKLRAAASSMLTPC